MYTVKDEEVKYKDEFKGIEMPQWPDSLSSVTVPPPNNDPEPVDHDIDRDPLDGQINEYIQKLISKDSLRSDYKTEFMQNEIRTTIHQFISCFKNKYLKQKYLDKMFEDLEYGIFDENTFIHCDSFYIKSQINFYNVESFCKNAINDLLKNMSLLMIKHQCFHKYLNEYYTQELPHAILIINYMRERSLKVKALKFLYIREFYDTIDFYLRVSGGDILLLLQRYTYTKNRDEVYQLRVIAE
jgi:hypothetical protein